MVKLFSAGVSFSPQFSRLSGRPWQARKYSVGRDGRRPAFSRRNGTRVLSVVPGDPRRAHAPLTERAQGKPGARCTRGLVCKWHIGKRTRAYRCSGHSPAFPAQWFYGLLRALPGDRLSCHRHPRDAQGLDASAGASGPHDFAVRDRPSSPKGSAGLRRRSSTRIKARDDASRPPRSGPRVVTIAHTPLGWAGMAEKAGDLAQSESELFFAEDLDSPNQLEVAEKFDLYAQAFSALKWSSGHQALYQTARGCPRSPIPTRNRLNLSRHSSDIPDWGLPQRRGTPPHDRSETVR